MPEQQVPQLRMTFRRFDHQPEPQPVPGYELRSFRPGDEDAWVALLATGDFGPWDRARLDRMLGGERAPMPHEGIFFVTKDGLPVAVVCTFFYANDDPPAAELGWVVVAPEHRGRGLARWMCAEAIAFMGARGYRHAFLKTEDYRPAAIRTYLALGFEPEMVDPAHPAWWAQFLAGSSHGTATPGMSPNAPS